MAEKVDWFEFGKRVKESNPQQFGGMDELDIALSAVKSNPAKYGSAIDFGKQAQGFQEPSFGEKVSEFLGVPGIEKVSLGRLPNPINLLGRAGNVGEEVSRGLAGMEESVSQTQLPTALKVPVMGALEAGQFFTPTSGPEIAAQAASGPVLKGAGKLLGMAGGAIKKARVVQPIIQALTKLKPRYAEIFANSAEEVFKSPGIRALGDRYADVLRNAGLPDPLIILKRMTGLESWENLSEGTAKRVLKRLQAKLNNGTIDHGEAVLAVQTANELKGTEAYLRNKLRRRELGKLRGMFDDLLTGNPVPITSGPNAGQHLVLPPVPGWQGLNRDYLLAATKDAITDILPRNKNGAPDALRSWATLWGVIHGHPESMLGSPYVIGKGVENLLGAERAIGKISGPLTRTAIAGTARANESRKNKESR